jgi:hypothetical protein
MTDWDSALRVSKPPETLHVLTFLYVLMAEENEKKMKKVIQMHCYECLRELHVGPRREIYRQRGHPDIVQFDILHFLSMPDRNVMKYPDIASTILTGEQ